MSDEETIQELVRLFRDHTCLSLARKDNAELSHKDLIIYQFLSDRPQVSSLGVLSLGPRLERCLPTRDASIGNEAPLLQSATSCPCLSTIRYT